MPKLESGDVLALSAGLPLWRLKFAPGGFTQLGLVGIGRFGGAVIVSGDDAWPYPFTLTFPPKLSKMLFFHTLWASVYVSG